MPSLEKLALNQGTIRQWSLEQAVDGFVRHGVPAIGIFRDKLAECGVERGARLVRDAGLTVTSMCAGGRFAPAIGGGWADIIDDNRRAIEETHALGAGCLVVIGGGLPPDSKDLPGARERIRDGLAEILPEANAAGITLAIEPQHPMSASDRGCISSLFQANEICDSLLSEPGGETVGIVFDMYHLWWEPGLEDQVTRATGRIRLIQVCDWLNPTTATRFQRGMMGDGIVDIPRLREAIEATGYDGFNEIEIFSEHWWQQDPDELVRICIERYTEFV